MNTQCDRIKRPLLVKFAAMCAMMAAMAAALLFKRQYPSGISNLFSLSMDLLGSLVCILLCYGCLSVSSAHDNRGNLLSSMLLINVMTLFFDVLIWFFSGNPSWRGLCILVSTLFYVAVNLLVLMFWRYARAVLCPDAPRSRWMDVLRYGSLAFVLLLFLVNLFTPVVFRMAPEGILEKALGYPLGSVHILLTFVLVIFEAFKTNLEIWKRGFTAVSAMVLVGFFLLTANRPQIAVSYTVATTAVLMSACVLYDGRIRLKELVIRVFSLLLLCAMLVYGPVIYYISFQEAISNSFETTDGVLSLLAHLLDDIGLDRLSDPGNTDLYNDTRAEMRRICQHFDLQNLYVETIDAAGVRSFVIAVAASDEDDRVVRKTLGWPGASVWSENSRLTEPEIIALTGEYTHQYSEQDNTYGHNLDWFYPYKDATGQVRALLGVDIAVEKQHVETAKHAIGAIIPALLLYCITLLMLLRMLDHAFLGPVHAISQHIQGFITDGNRKKARLSVKGGYEIELLSESFDFMTSELDEYEAARALEIEEKQRAAAEMELAANIQMHFLPGVFPAFPDRTEFDIHAFMRPAREVGGDFYDFFFIDDDHLAMVVADVSGKGIPAALFMMSSKTMLRAEARPGHGPADILEIINAQLSKDNDTLMFVTAWLGILEISTGRLTFSDAGHETPLLCRAGRWHAVEKQSSGPPLGIFEPDAPPRPGHGEYYTDYAITLQPGDGLFQYTDGIPEAINEDKAFFGEDGLLRALNAAPSPDPEAALNHVQQEIDAFVGDAPQFDDITMLCMRYHGRHT